MAKKPKAGGDPVAAIGESEATGETAELFADIRGTLGVPVVNLIWRHLAIFPGALPWAWAAVRPVYASGLAQTEAEALKTSLKLPELPKVPKAAFLAAGVPAGEWPVVRGVIAAYDHTNPMALLTLSALGQRMAGEAAVRPLPLPAKPPRARKPETLPALSGGEVAPEVAELIERVNGIGNPPDGRIVASMYRTLSHWPGSLAVLWALLAPLAADGRMDRVVQQTVAAAQKRARRLPVEPGPPPAALTAAARRSAAKAIGDFTTTAIGRMVPITAMLVRALPK